MRESFEIMSKITILIQVIIEKNRIEFFTSITFDKIITITLARIFEIKNKEKELSIISSNLSKLVKVQ